MVDRRSVLMGAGALVGATALGGAAQSATTPAAQLNATFESIFKELVANSPMTATGLGLDKGELAPLKAKLDPSTPAERARGQAFLEKSIAAIKKVDRSKLTGMDRINYDTVLWDYSNTLSGYKAFDFGAPGYPAPYAITQLTGSYQSLPDFLDSQHSIETKADADAYMSRLSGYATLLDQETARFKADVAKGVIAPDFALQKAITQLKGQRDTKAADSTLVTSITRRTKEKAIAGDWQTAATKAYETEVVAALDRQIAALEATLPKATHDAGVWHIPNGEAYYVFGARSGTSTDMTPDEIHKIGLDKVKEINAEIDRIMRPLGMTGGTTGERLKAMAKDPKFIYPNTDAGKQKLLDDLNAQIKVVEAKIPDYFGVYAKSPVTVRRVPVATELGAPGGYYWPASLDGSRPGAYYINLRDTAEVPSWTLPTLTYHEAVPGHHMQISIQQENKNLPMLRQISGFNAYIEGWALYSEEVAANDMGMYATDPYGRIGYLHDALFRACRLVVDTGMHEKRWTREQAMAFMDTNLGDPNETEIERYAVWPGQALGYMVGKIKWLELRAKMQAKQGAKFDIKTFHDTGLLAGAVPLAVLEQVYKDKGLI
ncbi:DUF885 domain-containing protein [Asticcacaulis endophyticus]|uniref:Tat pathway signal protein n=1 Tax=Asticcacaulis endophyticus TaxID=1395890 RepID=A0A918QC22_9CAUL|nr:DUF885 family protein [Asticcacaulis endophyticus]GGZ41484.1 Tat pathway signal protein [Asticcacaulis endophyticus]